jgi:hypothetical protein
MILTQKNNRDHMLEIMLDAHQHHNMPGTITVSETICRFLVFSGSSHHTLTHTVRILSHQPPVLSFPKNILEAQISTLTVGPIPKGLQLTYSSIGEKTGSGEQSQSVVDCHFGRIA